MRAAIKAIEYHLPETILTNDQLAAEFQDWSVDKIASKTGINERHIAGVEECASDLGVAAASKLFASGACQPSEIDFLLFCTQSPDYFLPTSACLMQDRLGIPTTAGALDFNLGCSGFVYGLGLAQGLIESSQASRVLLITGETYSKFIHPHDKSVRTVFGDAAAATLIRAVERDAPLMGPFVYGTDGRGAEKLIVPTGGTRRQRTAATAVVKQAADGNSRSEDNLFMDGAAIFNFTLNQVPKCLTTLLERARKTLDEVDYFIFHQANQFMMEHLRKKASIPNEKFCVHLEGCGNTVSSTIPIALHWAVQSGAVSSGDLVMLLGFGVGYSWAGTLIRWA